MMMTGVGPSERFGVYLRSMRVGSINLVGDSTSFVFDEDYLSDPGRPILGLYFEDNLHRAVKSNVSVPAWFSNLLPEGPFRSWIASDRGVSPAREMALLEHVGHDLPGAVTILREPDTPVLVSDALEEGDSEKPANEQAWRFSLAGVGLNLSLIESDDRLTLPASGLGGDWIVKFPSPEFDLVPINEYTTTLLASRSGITVPEFKLVSREELNSVPGSAWRGHESVAFAARRFDRGPSRQVIHIEDFAQVRGLRPEKKYDSSIETIGALCYRGSDKAALAEFVRRVTFNILVSNGDAHLKNWSLIYHDEQTPTLAPAYDLVSTAMYAEQRGYAPNLGLAFGKSKAYVDARCDTFSRLGRLLTVDGDELRAVSLSTIDAVLSAWPEVRDEMGSWAGIVDSIGRSIQARAGSLRVRDRGMR